MDLGHVPADASGEDDAEEDARDYADAGDGEALQEHIVHDVARLSAEGHANAELAGAAADGEGEDAGDADDGDEESDGSESAEDDGIELVGREDLGPNIAEGTGALDGLLRGDVVDGAGVGRGQQVGIPL